MTHMWREAEAGPQSYILSWFGNLLVSESRHDWIEQRAVDALGGDPPLLYVTGIDAQAGGESLLWKRHTRPRLLPTFRVEPSNVGVFLRCVPSEASGAMPDRYMSAQPHGYRVDLDREVASDWEKFLLVSQTDLANLLTLLSTRQIRQADDSTHAIRMEHGFVLVAGGHRFPLPAVLDTLERQGASGAQALTDDQDREVALA